MEDGYHMEEQALKFEEKLKTLVTLGKKKKNVLEVQEINEKLAENEGKEEELKVQIKERMMKIPNIIDDSVPIGKDDSENVEVERFGDANVPNFEIPYHADILESINGKYIKNMFETFKDCTFLNVVGIVQPYYENYQLMVMNLTDLGYQN